MKNIFLIMLFHPFEAFDIIKMERERSVKVWPAVFLILFAALEKYVYNYVVSFQFRGRELSNVNFLVEIGYVVIPIILWVVADFCMTAIMDGETKLKEVFVTSGYCLAPYILLTPILAILSHFLGSGEAGFYFFLKNAILVWVILLLFFALLRQNNYGLLKAIWVTLLSVLFMVVFAAVVIFVLALSIQLVTTLGDVLQEIERKML